MPQSHSSEFNLGQAYPHPAGRAGAAPPQPEVPAHAGPDDGPPDPYIGKMVGNCKILEKINEGGSSHIYRALNVNFGMERVVKILKPSLVDEGDYFQRFKQEAQLTARLDHPNILRIFDTGEVGKQFYIEMERVEGQTLRAFMGQYPRIRETDILAIAVQLAQALDYAHHVEIQTPDGHAIQGILHRDIKPENIMITPGKAVKLMDFGAAKPLNINTRTMQGSIVGTPHYMSPEQIAGGSLDARSDFFSLGVLLYELFAGRRPFEAEHLATLLWTIGECKYERLRKVRPSISPLSEELVERLLSKDPEHRPKSAGEILESLRISVGAFNSWGAGNPAKVPFSVKRLYPTMALALSAAALVLSALALWRAYSGPGPQARRKLASHFAALIDKGIDQEQKKDYAGAMDSYGLVPAPEDGGDRAGYVEAQLRLAALYFKRNNQLTKARSLLEGLRKRYPDPAIDAYLGQIYFQMALYPEAKERLDSAFASVQETVLKRSPAFNPNEFQRDVLYTYAEALDGQYTFIEPKQNWLEAAVQAWHHFSDFAGCGADGEDKRCHRADKRITELEALYRKGR